MQVGAPLGNVIHAPVHTEIVASEGMVARFDQDTFTVQLPRDAIRIRVRASGYRPADSTFAAGELTGGRLEVELPSLVIATPPLQVCPR